MEEGELSPTLSPHPVVDDEENLHCHSVGDLVSGKNAILQGNDKIASRTYTSKQGSCRSCESSIFRLAHLPSSSIKDIFNVNDDACKRESIDLDENVVNLNNNSNDKGFFSEACSKSEAQTEGKHQTDSELERDADATVSEPNCMQMLEVIQTLKPVLCLSKLLFRGLDEYFAGSR